MSASDIISRNTKKRKEEKRDNKNNYSGAEGIIRRNIENKASRIVFDELKRMGDMQRASQDNTNNRFTYDKNGNRKIAYLGDTRAYFDKVAKERNDYQKKSDYVEFVLKEYGSKIPNEDKKTITDFLKNNGDYYNELVNLARNDFGYFSQWEDEDSYNRAMSYEKEQKAKKDKYSAMTDEELDAEIKRLEKSKKGNALSNFANKVVGARENADLYFESIANQEHNDALKYDIALIEKEKTNRKHKQIDELPEDVKLLIDELTEIDSINDDEEFENTVNTLLSGFTGGSNVNYNTGYEIDRYKEIIQELEGKGVENWQELVAYNKLRYNEAKNTSTKEEYAQMAEDHPALSSFVSIPASLGKGLGAIEMIKNVGSDVPIDPNSPYFGMNDLVNTTRETVMDNYDYHLKTGNGTLDNIDVFDELYGIAMSMGDSIVAGVGSAGLKGAGGLVLGLSAASDSSQEVAENGGSASDAIMTGLVAGVNEMLWESLSLGKLDDLLTNGVSQRGFKGFVKEVLKSAGFNASEEFNTEAANLVADYFINGGASTYSETVKKYLSLGYTNDEAKSQAQKDMLAQMAKAGVGGALQGLFMGIGAGGISTVATEIDNKARENKFYNQQGQNIIDQGNVSQLKEEAKGLGDKKILKALKNLADETTGAKTEALDEKSAKKYAHQVGQVYKSVQEAQFKSLGKSSETAFRNVIRAELESAGVDNVDKTADILVKAMYKEGLTRAESNIFNSVNGLDIINKVMNSTELTTEQEKQYTKSAEKYVNTEMLTKDLSSNKKAEILNADGYKVSTDGRITIEATDEEVNIESIDSFGNGDVSVKLNTGEVVAATELKMDSDTAVVIKGLKELQAEGLIDASVANDVMKINYNKMGLSAEKFILGTMDAIRYGAIGYDGFLKTGEFTRFLPEETRRGLFEKGRKFAEEKDETKANILEKKRQERINSGKGKVRASGKIKFDGVKYKDLNNSQKAQVDLLEVVFSAMGINVEFFASPVVNGRHVGENGLYDRKTNTIRIDVFAGNNGEGLMLFTASHELTHFIREWSPVKFRKFAKFLLERYGEKDVSVKSLIEAKIKNAKLNGRTITFDTAYEEVVADACESFLRDSNAKDALVALAQVDESIHEKVVRWIKDFVKLIENAINALKGAEPTSKESKYVLNDLENNLEKFHDMWDEALLDARENAQWVESSRTAEETKNTTDEGDVKLSVREDFAEQLQDWKNGFGKAYGKYNGSYFNLGTTSDVLVKHGASKTDLIMYEECILKVTGGKHSISLDEIAKLPYELDDPVLLFKGSVNNSFVALTEMVDKEGNDVIVAVHINKKHKRTVINKIASIYSKSDDFGNNKITNYVSKQISDGNLLDASIKKAPMWFTNRGLQLPKLVQTIINADNSIRNHTENVKSVGENPTIAGIDYDALSSAKNENGNELFQYRAIQHDVPEYRRLLEEYSDMSSSQINSLFDTMNKVFAKIEENLEILDYAWDENLNEDGTWDDSVDARAFNPVKPNSDKLYKYSLDFSTLCRKRLLQQVIAEELSLALDRAVTKAEGIAIRNELIKLQEEGRQIEIACALCYVESARMKSPEQIQKFLNDAGQMVREFFATKAKGSVAEAEEKARKSVAKKYAKEIKEGAANPTETYTTKSGKVKYIALTKLSAKMKKEIQVAKKAAKSSYTPSTEEQRIIDVANNLPTTAFTTADGLKKLAKENPVIFDAYTSFVRNATHSKGTEKDVWYRVGDVEKIGDDLIAAMNKENGLRSQSWSDFQVIHLLDYVGAIIELSTRNAKMQAYTKVPDYVNLMGLTGQMINLSLIPAREFNGKLEFDSVEGMAFKMALELRDKYPDTAGTISIGITNEQIQMLLDSMDIDYVIPYHRSSMKKVVRKEMRIPNWDDYENYQGEKNITSKKDALANAKKYGVQLLGVGDKNYQKAPSFSEWFDFEEARQIAQLENRNPTDKKAQKKYGVMYGGYKAMQNAANNYLKLCAERGLIPKFCHQKADFTTEENYWKLLIDRKMINQKTGEIIEQKSVQPIFDEGEVLNILNNEVARYESVKEDFDYAVRTVTEKFLNGDMNEDVSKIAKSINDTVTNVTKVAVLNSNVQDGIKRQDRVTPEQDAEYLELAKNPEKNEARLRELVEKAAKRAGYNSPMLFHGTPTGFGFTVFDANKVDDKLSFFATDDEKIAKTYSGETNRRAISERITVDVDNASPAELLELMQKYVDESYRVVSKAELAELKKPLVEIIRKAAENAREFILDNSYAFNNEKRSVAYRIANSISAMAEAETEDALDGARASYQDNIWELRAMDTSIAYEFQDAIDTHKLFRAVDDIDLYSRSEAIFTNGIKTINDNSAWTILSSTLYTGVYSLYGSTENMLEIDANGANWNRINTTPIQAKHYVTIEDGYDNTNVPKMLAYNDAQSLAYDMAKSKYGKNAKIYTDNTRDERGNHIVEFRVINDGMIGEKVLTIEEGLSMFSNTRGLARYAKDAGYEGVKISNLKDSGGAIQYNAPGGIYIFFDSNHMKSADLVTYDDNGEIIPLSQRFNEGNEDIRYQDRPYQPSPEDLGIDYKADNEKLKADVDRLKEMLKLQSTVTHGKVLAKGHYDKVARNILHEFGMPRVTDKELVKEFVAKLDSFYTYIINDDELMWDEMFEKAMEMAKWLDSKLPEQVVYKNDNAFEILRDIREKGIMLSDEQKKEAAYYAGSLSAYRKMNIGSFRIVNEGGVALTDLWEQLMADYPGAIPKEILEEYADKAENIPRLLPPLIEFLRQTQSVIDEDNQLSHLRDMATAIYDSYWQVPTVKTLADKHQQKVNLLKSKHKTEMDALKEKNASKLRGTKEYYQDMLKRVRDDRDAKMEAYKEHVAEQKKKNVEGRNKTATKNKIKRVIKTLESLYSNPTKEKNVKIEFQDMVSKALVMADAIFGEGNISSADILSGDITIQTTDKEKKLIEEWKKAYARREEYRKNLDALESSENVNPKTHDELLKMISTCNNKLNKLSRDLSGVVERQKGYLNDHSVQSAIDSLVDAYKSLEESPEGYAKAAYNDYVAKRLDALKTSLKNTTVKTMTLTQMDEIYQAYKMVLTTVRTANEIFVKNKRLSVTEMGETVISEVKRVAEPTDDKIAMLRELKKFVWDELKPIYAFERIGSDTLLDLFEESRRGEDVFGVDIAEAMDFFQNASKKYGYESWDFKETKDFVLADGRTFTLSLEDIMSIYAYSRREQAIDHITKGGFVYDNSEFFTDTKEKGLKGKIKKERTTVKAYRLNDDMFYKIINSLTDEQKKFTEDMQGYLTQMGEKGNEVSRVLYGIDIFNEKIYFPLVSSHDFIQSTNNPAGEVALKNTGMAKATVPHARNPIVLKGFMDVWNEHINKMATYHAFVLPIENLNKVFNYTGYAHEDESVSVQTILKGVYGQAVNDYITNFITDLNGGVKAQSSGNLLTKGISLFKKTAVAASTSVVIQQPTAVIRAMAMINPKYFAHKPDGVKHNEAWEELKKYAPVAIIKEMGGFDVGSGRQVGEYITAKEYKGKDKLKGFFTDSAYRDDALMWGATKADEMAWIYIWNAVKEEIADTTTYKVGSREFLDACGERFTDVITHTQVYDSVFSRSGHMRNKGEISKMATSFMGEPTTSFNMLYNAVLQAKRGNMSKGESAKIIGAVFGSIILAAVAKSFIYALRDDDEDEAYAEKYTQALTNSLKEDLFVPNMLPYVSDITSLLSGWDVERTDMAILKDIKDAWDGLDSSSKSGYRKAEDLAGAIAAFGGIPLKNVMRTVREMYNAVANIFDENTAGAGDIGDAVTETIFGEESASDINEALSRGRTTKAKNIIDNLVSEKVEQGKTEKEAKASIKASVTSYWKAKYLQAYRDKDNAEMLRIRQILQSTGLYDDVIKTCQNWIKGMKDDTTNTTYRKW